MLGAFLPSVDMPRGLPAADDLYRQVLNAAHALRRRNVGAVTRRILQIRCGIGHEQTAAWFGSHRAHRVDRSVRALSVAIPVLAYI